MKKIFAFCFILVLLSAAATAQVRPRERVNSLRIERTIRTRQLTRPEVIQLRKQMFRHEMIKRRTDRDGVVVPYEGRKLSRLKRQNRRERLRLLYNDRKRIQ